MRKNPVITVSLKSQHNLQGPASEEFPWGCKKYLKKAQKLAQGFVPREA